MAPPIALTALWLLDWYAWYALNGVSTRYSWLMNAGLLLIIGVSALVLELGLAALLTPTQPLRPPHRYKTEEAIRERVHFVAARCLRNPIRPRSATWHAETIERTYGLDLVSVWPFLAPLLPAEARRESDQADKRLANAILGSAGGVTTAIVALILMPGIRTRDAGFLFGFSAFTGLATAMNLGRKIEPLQGALYATRGRLVRLYRFQLYEALHLPLPDDPEVERTSVAPIANDCFESHMRGGYYHGLAVESSSVRPALDQLAAADRVGLVNELRETLMHPLELALAESRNVSNELRKSLADRAYRIDLSSDEFDALAARVAEEAASALKTRVEREVRRIEPELLRTVRSAIEVSVDGPALTEFCGFVVVDLVQPRDDSIENQPGHVDQDGVIRMTRGGRLHLLVAVLADARARDKPPTRGSDDSMSLVFADPVVTTGGQRNATVVFEALIDSPTLSAEPNRKSLHLGTIIGDDHFVTVIQVPSEPMKHEIWLQLYEKGRLVQASTVLIDTHLSANGVK